MYHLGLTNFVVVSCSFIIKLNILFISLGPILSLLLIVYNYISSGSISWVEFFFTSKPTSPKIILISLSNFVQFVNCFWVKCNFKGISYNSAEASMTFRSQFMSENNRLLRGLGKDIPSLEPVEISVLWGAQVKDNTSVATCQFHMKGCLTEHVIYWNSMKELVQNRLMCHHKTPWTI